MEQITTKNIKQCRKLFAFKKHENYQSSEMNFIIATRCCAERKISYRVEWNCGTVRDEDPRATHDANKRFICMTLNIFVINSKRRRFETRGDLCLLPLSELLGKILYYTLWRMSNESRKILTTWIKLLVLFFKEKPWKLNWWYLHILEKFHFHFSRQLRRRQTPSWCHSIFRCLFNFIPLITSLEVTL